jgi:hypothetical protein
MTSPQVVTAAALLALAFTGSASGAGVELVSRDEPLTAARFLADGERVLPARTAPIRFNLVGLHWRGGGRVWFRTARVDGVWSRWRAARPEAEDGPDATSVEAKARRGWKIGNPHWTDAARRIQYRLAGRVVKLRAHFVSSAIRAPSRLAAIAGTPEIISRRGWGANESIVRGSPRYAGRLAFAVVHNTAGSSPSTPQESAAIVRAIQRYHVISNGWSDVGYNFLVDRFGQIFEGRRGGVGRNVVGAHAAGFNTGSAGVAVIGSYSAAAISPDAREALVSLLAWRLDVGHVDPVSRLAWTSAGSPKYPSGTRVWIRAVSGHRDLGLTSCPGSVLYGALGNVAAAAAARGLPKIYSPRVAGSFGEPIRFTARLSTASAWTVTVFDGAGAAVASGQGTGTTVDWTWDARAVAPGRYSYAIKAGPGFRPARGRLGSFVPLALSAVGARPSVVTPNGDGTGDTTVVSLNVTVPASARAWLENPAGARVARVFGARAVPAGTTRIRWNPEAVPDGLYRIVVEASSGTEQHIRRAAVVIDRTLGALVLAPGAFSPNGDATRDTTTFRFDLLRDADVTVRVVAGATTVATLFSGRLAAGPRQTYSWDGRRADGGTAPDGRYRGVVKATTTLGTRRLSRELILDTTPPRLSSLSAVRYGQLTLGRFVLSEKARVAISLRGTLVRVWRDAGSRSVWIPATGRYVRAVPQDRAGNVGRTVWAAVQVG